MTTLDGVEVEEDEQEGLEVLVAALLEEDVLATLVHNLQRIDEASNPLAGGNPLTATATAEAQAVHNTLGEAQATWFKPHALDPNFRFFLSG